MSDYEEAVVVIVAGMQLANFQEINITRGANDAAISFAMKCTNPAWSASAYVLREGAEVEIMAISARFGSTLICRGYVDEYEADTGEDNRREVRISGRSKSQDAIDCPPAKHKTGRIEKKTLLDAAKEFDEFGTGWTADVPLRPIPKIQRDPDDTVFDTIDRYARAEGLLLTGQPDGGVKITRAGTKRHAGRIAIGEAPCRSMSIKFSAHGKRSVITAMSQDNLGVGDKALRKAQQVYDENVGRYRPAIILTEREADDPALKRRAGWQRARRQAESVSATGTLHGWRDASGLLWEPGRLVAAYAPDDRLDQDLAVSDVTFTQNGDGTTATVTLVDPKSLGGKGGKGKSGSGWNTVEGDL